MSSDEPLELVIDLGYDLMIARYYSIAAITIFFYDFLLTLVDEIKYVWHGRKSWVFAIFLANRYLPIGYQIWFLYTNLSPTFHGQLCHKTAFFAALAAVETTLLAQVVLTLRIYAVTSKNRIITSFLCVITISQVILGLYLMGYAAKHGTPETLIAGQVYMMCIVFLPQWRVLFAFPMISLGYDVLVFSVIVYLVVRSNISKVPIPRLLRIIAQDATYYFLVIFASHLAAVMYLWFGEYDTELLIFSVNPVYLSVMITRLLISLKKATTSQQIGWSFGEPTAHTTLRSARRRGGGDEIRLDTFASTQVETQLSRA